MTEYDHHAAYEAHGNQHLDLSNQLGPRPRHRVVAAVAARYCPPEGSFLDLGCGLGEVARLFQARAPGADLWLADSDPRCIEAATRELSPSGSFEVPEHPFDLSPIDQRFDVVVASHVLEHLHAPVAAVEAMLGLLRPGGHLILAVPNPIRPTAILHALLRRHYVNRGHVVAWDRSHWINFLERICGVEVVEYPQDNLPIAPRILRNMAPELVDGLELALGRVFPWLTFSNLAVVRCPSP